MNGVGVVGETLLEAFEDHLVVTHAFVGAGVDERGVVEGFIEGYDGGQRAAVGSDEVAHVFALLFQRLVVDGVGLGFTGVIGGLADFTFRQQVVVAVEGVDEVVENPGPFVGELLEVPEELALGRALDTVGDGEVVPAAGDGDGLAEVGQGDDVVVQGGVEVVEAAVGGAVEVVEVAVAVHLDGVDEDDAVGRHLFEP